MSMSNTKRKSLLLPLIAVMTFGGSFALELACPSRAEAQVDWGTGDDGDKPKPKRNPCAAGKERNDDTSGQCCWPGQAWNGKQCVGIPTKCPEGLTADSAQQACVIPGCLAEMVLMTDQTHCCWAGQAWSKTRSECIGTPECPENYVLQAGTCNYVPPDQDNDGIIDTADDCPDAKEDVDGFEDLDGCPDEDNDRDTIPDLVDKCPDVAEDLDGVLDKDGCPDLDDDKDGIPDTLDQCLSELEDMDGFEDEDGCRDPDNDRDSIADYLDQCPDVAEDFNDFRDTDGCPDEAERVAEGTGSAMAIIGYSSLGLGVAASVTGLVLHLEAESKRNEVLDPTQRNKIGWITSVNQKEAQILEDDANTFDTVAAISISAGAALIVTGTVLLVLRYTNDSPEAPVSEVSFSADPIQGVLFLSGRF